MFSSGPNYNKLKTNLRLALNRLKLLEKKKAELAQKSRKEIGDYLATGKIERARIRVEHIIREDYLVEAMEIVEMYCDMLLARFGLVTQMKELDDGIAEAVSSLVWVCPRLQSDVDELKVISDIFISKYGPQFAERARTATGEHHVSEKLMHKLQLQAPPKLLVEKYLIEIAKNYNIEYEPDPQVMKDDRREGPDHYLIDLSDRNNLGGGGGRGGGGGPPQMGFIGYPTIPPLPNMPEPPTTKPFNYPPYGGNGGGGGGGVGGGPAVNTGASGGAAGGFQYNIPPTMQPMQPPTLPPQTSPSNSGYNEKKDLNTNFIDDEKTNNFATPSANSNATDDVSPDENLLRPKMHNDPPPRYSSIDPYNLQGTNKPKPQPRLKMVPPPSSSSSSSQQLPLTGPSAPPPSFQEAFMPILPNVPNDLPDIQNHNNRKNDNDDEIDFDDLSRRFENLKKRQ